MGRRAASHLQKEWSQVGIWNMLMRGMPSSRQMAQEACCAGSSARGAGPAEGTSGGGTGSPDASAPSSSLLRTTGLWLPLAVMSTTCRRGALAQHFGCRCGQRAASASAPLRSRVIESGPRSTRPRLASNCPLNFFRGRRRHAAWRKPGLAPCTTFARPWGLLSPACAKFEMQFQSGWEYLWLVHGEARDRPFTSPSGMQC